MADHMSQQQSAKPANSVLMRLFSDMTESWYDATRRTASLYVDLSEDWAKGAVEWQNQTSEFLKEASPLLERQSDITRTFVERSTEVARQLVQMQMDRGEEVLQRTMNRSEDMQMASQG